MLIKHSPSFLSNRYLIVTKLFYTSMSENTHLTRRIIRRVRTVYYTRMLLSQEALKLYALFMLLIGLVSTVSVREVIANVPDEGLGALYNFVLFAVVHTELVVQLMLAGILATLLWIFRDVFQHLSFSRQASF